jgi:beta-glucanase (GH16 family)
MKKSVVAIVGIAALVLASGITAESAKAYDTSGYALVWSDEFNGSSVDASKWSPLDLPDNVNGSQEYYRPQNAVVSGGYLNLIGKRENYGGRSYTSGSLTSYGKFSFTYGKAVARMQMPVGQGYWPAFWMIGDHAPSWPAGGELDIMESIGQNFVVGTAHWDNNGHQSSGGTYNVPVTAFHDYEMEWTPQSIIWRVDGVQYYSISSSTNGAFLSPTKYYFYLNMAIGGTWPGNPTSATVFPATTLVDYVRVYQKSSQTTTPSPTPNPTPTQAPNPTPTPAPSSSSGSGGAGTCSASYSVGSAWNGGFVSGVNVTAGSTPIKGWKVTMTLPSGVTITNLWSGVNTGTSGTVNVTNANYNGSLSAGQSTSFGLQGTGTGTGATVSCTAT